jgi:hypothetical protein
MPLKQKSLPQAGKTTGAGQATKPAVPAGQHPVAGAADDRRDDGLRRAVRLGVVQELADDMAHDLNNVLTVIAGSLQLFLMQQGGETQQHHFVRNAIEAALRGARMTGGLLAYATPQVVEHRSFDLAALLRAFGPLLRDTLGNGFDFDDSRLVDGPPVEADSRFIESLLLATAQLARRDAAGPGSAKLQSCRIDGPDARRRSGAVDAGCGYILLSATFSAAGVSPASVRQALTPGFAGAIPPDRLALDISASYAAIRQAGGDVDAVRLTGAASGHDVGMILDIMLPVAGTAAH